MINDMENEQGSLFNNVTPTISRLISTSVDVSSNPPDKIDFIHAALCQVGMPRRAVTERVFERRNGDAVLRIEAGALFNGREFVEKPIPYGTRPRLIMVHASTEAVRTGSPKIHVGDSLADFLRRLGIDSSGGAKGGITMFRKQLEALAACRLLLGLPSSDGRVRTINTEPFTTFDIWINHSAGQKMLWPGTLELSQTFFETLTAHAVPLDHRALTALKHSALALDIYTWLAYRLCRIRKHTGIKISWLNLRDQFGQEYNDSKDFKRTFKQALRQVLSVYPDAIIDDVPGGLLLRPSSPPIPRTLIHGLSRCG